MSSKTKILLFRRRECIYTLLFLALGVILIILAVLMFLPASRNSQNTVPTFAPGIYTSQITLQDAVMDVEVRADHAGIHSIGFRNISDSVSAMYPLMQPSLDQLARQICDTQSLDNIYYEKSSQYTSQMLLSAIRSALNIAESP